MNEKDTINKEKILEYFKNRRDGIQKMMQKHFTETGGVHCCQTEVFFTYNAIISNIESGMFGGSE